MHKNVNKELDILKIEGEEIFLEKDDMGHFMITYF